MYVVSYYFRKVGCVVIIRGEGGGNRRNERERKEVLFVSIRKGYFE